MNPFIRYLVVGVVGFIVAAALGVLGLVSSQNPTIQVIALLGGALIVAGVCVYLFIQAWRWSVRAYRERRTGRSIAVAVAGGMVVIMAAGALAVAAILALLFVG